MQTGQRVSVTIGAPIQVEGRELPALMTEVRDFLVKNVENASSPSP